MTIVLKDVGSGFKRTAINENFDTIKAEINDNLISKLGGKQLEADLDANSNRLLNVAPGVLNTDGINLQQLSAAIVAAGSGLIASQREVQTGAQVASFITTFTGITYTVDGNNLYIFLNGNYQTKDVDYTETSPSSITWLKTINSTDSITAITNLSTTNTTADTAGITHTQSGTSYNLATYLQNRKTIHVEDFGADGTGVTECATEINAAIEYGRANRMPVRAYGKYNVASTILFAAGRHDFSMSPIVNILQATDQGFKWSGANNSTIVEVLDVKDSLFGTFTISGQTATGMLGFLQHASNATLYGHNVFDRICVQNTLYGVRLGDYTNDGYDSNVEQNIYRQMYFYSVDNPLLLDSDAQDLIRINNFIVGGGTAEVARDYLIRVLRNGNQLQIDYLFGRSDDATVDTDLIDIQDGTIYIGNGSLEGTDTCRAIAIKDTLARGQSKISLVTADGMRDSSGSAAYFRGKSGVSLENCTFSGHVEVDRYTVSSNNTIFSGAYDFIRTSTGEIEEINTAFRTSQAAEITVGSERSTIRNGSLINSSLVTIGNAVGTQSVAAVNSLTNATAYNFATIDMSNNATSIGVEVTMMLGRNSSTATVGSIYKIYYSACRDSAGNVTVATPIIDVSCLAEDSLTPALSADTNVSGTDVQLRVTQSSGATLGAIFEIKSMTIVNNSGGFNSLIS